MYSVDIPDRQQSVNESDYNKINDIMGYVGVDLSQESDDFNRTSNTPQLQINTISNTTTKTIANIPVLKEKITNICIILLNTFR